jgi:hypothetical protein
MKDSSEFIWFALTQMRRYPLLKLVALDNKKKPISIYWFEQNDLYREIKDRTYVVSTRDIGIFSQEAEFKFLDDFCQYKLLTFQSHVDITWNQLTAFVDDRKDFSEYLNSSLSFQKLTKICEIIDAVEVKMMEKTLFKKVA